MSNSMPEEDPMCECNHRRALHVFEGCVVHECPCKRFVSIQAPKLLEVARNEWKDGQGGNLLLCVLHELSPEHRTRQAVAVVLGLSVCSTCLPKVVDSQWELIVETVLDNARHGKI